MKLDKFLKAVRDADTWYQDDDRIEVEFVGIKWQDEHHPSAEIFPIDFVDVKSTGKTKITVKFITKPKNP